MNRPEKRCSFCGKKQGEVRLIAGPGVFICNLCVALCNEILAHDSDPTWRPEPPPATTEPGGKGAAVRAVSSPAAD
jgi:hypothetical protein